MILIGSNQINQQCYRVLKDPCKEMPSLNCRCPCCCCCPGPPPSQRTRMLVSGGRWRPPNCPSQSAPAAEPSDTRCRPTTTMTTGELGWMQRHRQPMPQTGGGNIVVVVVPPTSTCSRCPGANAWSGLPYLPSRPWLLLPPQPVQQLPSGGGRRMVTHHTTRTTTTTMNNNDVPSRIKTLIFHNLAVEKTSVLTLNA